MTLKHPWFVVKRYGFGLTPSGWGWPFTLAWLVLIGFAVVFAARFGRAATAAVVTVLLAGFFVVMAVTSDGKPWRWRNWGDES
jgi:hypothetical protein